jgi:hypothetical protein
MTKVEILQNQLKDLTEELRTLKNYIKRLETEHDILYTKYSNLKHNEEIYKQLGVEILESRLNM